MVEHARTGNFHQWEGSHFNHLAQASYSISLGAKANENVCKADGQTHIESLRGTSDTLFHSSGLFAILYWYSSYTDYEPNTDDCEVRYYTQSIPTSTTKCGGSYDFDTHCRPNGTSMEHEHNSSPKRITGRLECVSGIDWGISTVSCSSYMWPKSPELVSNHCIKHLPDSLESYTYSGDARTLFTNTNGNPEYFGGCYSSDNLGNPTAQTYLTMNSDNTFDINISGVTTVPGGGDSYSYKFYFTCKDFIVPSVTRTNHLKFTLWNKWKYPGTDSGTVTGLTSQSDLDDFIQYFELDSSLTPFYEFTKFYKSISISTPSTPYNGCGFEFEVHSTASGFHNTALLDQLNANDNTTAYLFLQSSLNQVVADYSFFIRAVRTGNGAMVPNFVTPGPLQLRTFVRCSSLSTTLVDSSNRANPTHIQSIQVNMTQPTNIFMNDTAFAHQAHHTSAPYDQQNLGFPLFWFQTSDFPCTTTIPSLNGGLTFSIHNQNSHIAPFSHPDLVLQQIQQDISGYSDLYYVKLSNTATYHDDTAILGDYDFWIVAQDGNKPFPNNLTVPCRLNIYCVSYMQTTGDNKFETCQRRLPNEKVTFSVLKMFDNSDGSNKNFGNCVELPTEHGPYPPGVSIPTSSTNIELTKDTYSTARVFQYTFKCENLDCPNKFTKATAEITIYDPTTMLDGLVTKDGSGSAKAIPQSLTQYSELTPANWPSHQFPTVDFKDFWDIVKQPGSSCGWSFAVGTSQTDYAWPGYFDNDFDLASNPLNYDEAYGRSSAKVSMDSSLLTVPGEYPFVIVATSDTSQTKPPQFGSYQRVVDRNINNHNLPPTYTASSPQGCEQYCDAKPLCQSIEYNVDHRHGKFNSRNWNCRLQSSSNPQYYDQGKQDTDLLVRTKLVYPQTNVHKLVTFIQCIQDPSKQYDQETLNLQYSDDGDYSGLYELHINGGTDPGKVIMSSDVGGSNIQLQATVVDNRQLWRIELLANGLYTIRVNGDTNPGKEYLTGNAINDVSLQPRDSTLNLQEWDIMTLASGKFKIRLPSGMTTNNNFLSSTINGNVQTDQEGSGQQRWKLVKLDISSSYLRKIHQGEGMLKDQKVDVGTSSVYFELKRFTCVTPFTSPGHNESYVFTYQVIPESDYSMSLHYNCLFNSPCSSGRRLVPRVLANSNIPQSNWIEPLNVTVPDADGKLYFYPNDPNTVSFIKFYLLVSDEKKPDPNKELFGPYTLNLTCDNNIIDPTLNISGQVNITKIKLYQASYTTKKNEYELLFNNFSVSLQFCEIVSYNLSIALADQNRFIEYSDIPNPLFGKAGFNMTVNTEKIKDYIFAVRAQDKWGNQAYSHPLQISIIPVPASDVNLDWKPMLLSDPIDYNLILDRTLQLSEFELPLPEVYDHDKNFDTVLLSSDTIDERFMSYDKEKNAIQLSIPCQVYDLLVGTHTINIQLVDESRGNKKYEQQLTFTLSRESKRCGIEYVPEQKLVEFVGEERVTAEIEDIDPYGIVTVEFNTYMQTDHVNLTTINSTFLDLYIEPSEDWHLFDDTFSIDPATNMTNPSLNFTWEVISYKRDQMVFNLTFIDPVQISPKVLRDNLVIHVKNVSDIFYARDFRVLHPDNRTLFGEVPKQMNTTISEAAKVVNDALKVTMITTALMSPMVFGPLYFMVAMINHLQLVIHLPMIEVAVPANTLMVQGYLIEIATFDIIPEEKTDAAIKWTLKKCFGFEFEDDEDKEEFIGDIPGQVQDLGFDSHYLQRNVYTILVFMGLWVFKSILYWIMTFVTYLLKLCHNQKIEEEPESQDEENEGGSPDTDETNKAEEQEEPFAVRSYRSCMSNKRALSKRIFFTEIIWLLLEPYLDLLIILFMQIKSDNLNIFVHQTFAVGVFVFIIIPFTLIWVSTRPKEKLLDRDFKRKWGSLYSEFKLDNTGQVMYYFIFVIKRLFFVIICYTDYLRAHNSIMLIIFAIFFQLIAQYHGRYMPHKSLSQNRIDLTNEFFFALHIYMIMCYTEFVPEQGTIFKIGWIHCITLGVQILYNFYFVLKELLRTCRLGALKVQQRCREENEAEDDLQKKCQELIEDNRKKAEEKHNHLKMTMELQQQPWYQEQRKKQQVKRMKYAVKNRFLFEFQQNLQKGVQYPGGKKAKSKKEKYVEVASNGGDEEGLKVGKKSTKQKLSSKDKSQSLESTDSLEQKPKTIKQSKKSKMNRKGLKINKQTQPQNDFILEVENYALSERDSNTKQDSQPRYPETQRQEPELNIVTIGEDSMTPEEEAYIKEVVRQQELDRQAHEKMYGPIKRLDEDPVYIEYAKSTPDPPEYEPEQFDPPPQVIKPEIKTIDDFEMSLEDQKQVLQQLGLDYDELYGDKANSIQNVRIPSKNKKKPRKKKKKTKVTHRSPRGESSDELKELDELEKIRSKREYSELDDLEEQ